MLDNDNSLVYTHTSHTMCVFSSTAPTTPPFDSRSSDSIAEEVSVSRLRSSWCWLAGADALGALGSTGSSSSSNRCRMSPAQSLRGHRCNAGFTGPNGGPCTVSSGKDSVLEPTTSPPRSTPEPVAVEATPAPDGTAQEQRVVVGVRLAMTAQDFRAKEASFLIFYHFIVAGKRWRGGGAGTQPLTAAYLLKKQTMESWKT